MAMETVPTASNMAQRGLMRKQGNYLGCIRIIRDMGAVSTISFMLKRKVFGDKRLRTPQIKSKQMHIDIDATYRSEYRLVKLVSKKSQHLVLFPGFKKLLGFW